MSKLDRGSGNDGQTQGLRLAEHLRGPANGTKVTTLRFVTDRCRAQKYDASLKQQQQA